LDQFLVQFWHNAMQSLNIQLVQRMRGRRRFAHADATTKRIGQGGPRFASLRKKIEMLFAHLKRILKLDRLRLRGPNGARDEFILAVAAQNLRKMAKLMPMPTLRPAEPMLAPLQ
jgi:hypothetical protein